MLYVVSGVFGHIVKPVKEMSHYLSCLFKAPSRRGDLQILGFCLLHWLCGSLPWDNVLRDPIKVQEAKERCEFGSHIPELGCDAHDDCHVHRVCALIMVFAQSLLFIYLHRVCVVQTDGSSARLGPRLVDTRRQHR